MLIRIHFTDKETLWGEKKIDCLDSSAFLKWFWTVLFKKKKKRAALNVFLTDQEFVLRHFQVSGEIQLLKRWLKCRD